MNSEQVKQLINKLNVLKKASQKNDMKTPSEENFQNQKKPTPKTKYKIGKIQDF